MGIIQQVSQRLRRGLLMGKTAGGSFGRRDVVTVLPRDAIMAVVDPVAVYGRDAYRQMRDNETVLGVEINGETRAYPLSILSVHQVVNDTLGGTAIAATW